MVSGERASDYVLRDGLWVPRQTFEDEVIERLARIEQKLKPTKWFLPMPALDISRFKYTDEGK